jgi:PIN domain nuclease of toxin-antitoxin system
MRLLLDTHALIWWLAGADELSAEARSAIASPRSEVFVSAASAWEMSIKRAKGRLDSPPDLPEALESSGFAELPIAIHHAILAGSLPPHHADPFDRLLVAQALLDSLTLVTRDMDLAAYDIDVLEA